jgi:exodeoxyribonuclease VII small subunit
MKMKKELETSMKRLDEISTLMSDDSLSLEDALKLYEEASELAKACQAEMADARLALKELFLGGEA